MREGGAGPSFCTLIALVCCCCPGWKAEAQFWCFLGKALNAKKANQYLSLWTSVSHGSVGKDCSQERVNEADSSV